MKRPSKCPPELYQIMQMCWSADPEKRPKFSHLRNLLGEIRFLISEAREDFISPETGSLELSKGDHVIVVTEE